MAQTTSARPKIINVSVLLYRWLLMLGPGEFRRDYSIPAIQDFRQCLVDAYQKRGFAGVIALWPLLFGEALYELLAEYRAEIFGRRQPMLPTIRRSMVAAFWAFVLFSMAIITMGRITDPAAPFDAVGRAHPEVGIAYSIASYSWEIALLAIVLGGLPILFVAVKRAIPGGLMSALKLFVIKPKLVLRLIGASLLITICFLVYLLATELLSGPPSCTAASGCIVGQPLLLIMGSLAAIVSGVALFVFVILAITASLSGAVLRSEFDPGMLRFSLVPISILALVMSAATFATTFWLIRLWIVAPQFAASGAGLGNGQSAWVIAMIGAMALSTLITAGALGSGLKACQLPPAQQN